MQPITPLTITNGQPRWPVPWCLLRRLLAGLAFTALGGCASTFLVDNEVQSFARWGPQAAAPALAGAVPLPPQNYRFERLPSQQDGAAAQSQTALENLALQALQQVGWSAVAPGMDAPWLVQVNAQTDRLPRAPWEEPWAGYWGPHGSAYWSTPWPGRVWHGSNDPFLVSGHWVWPPVFMRLETPYYQRQVSLVVRRAADGTVAYETRAAHDGPWHGSPSLWRAMLEAALRDFPAPPAGVRKVNIEVPR